MADHRYKFIVNTSAEFFNASCPQEEDTSAAIKEFFDNEEITILAATRHDVNNSSKIQFYHRIPADVDCCLLFYKVPQIGQHQLGGNRNSNGQQNRPSGLGLLTLEGGMVKSIYNSVSRVFAPHIAQQRNEYGPELSGLLENLHVSLGTTLGLPQTGITSIQDEINFWNHKSANSSTKSDRGQAQTFATILEKINKQIRQIDQTSPSSIEEFLDSAHNNLDEIWRLPYHYPQNRMADLMDVICSQIIETCVENLSSEDVWNLSSYHVNNLMNQVLDITESWLNLCDSLTRLFWPNYGQHPWIGKPHTPHLGQTFKERLSEIKNIKNLYRQIITLLEDENLRDMFTWSSPFKAINIFDTSPTGQSKWNKALNLFEQLLQPIDERIALEIKSQINTYKSNPRQIIFIFSKYETLIQRPTVLEILTIEREKLLQSIASLMRDLKKAVTDLNNETNFESISPICNECRWLRIVQHQLYEIEKVNHLVNGREGYEQVNQTLQDFKEEVDTLLRTNFEIWTDQSVTAVKSGQLKLRDDQPVVEFEREGRQLMRVTYNPELVTFCQDVREFENMGFKVPIELRSSAEHAHKFMAYARRLQRIATFHNTIGDRMIPCQRPIMLKNAIELSKLVQSESVAWNDEESVKRYVSTLQVSVNKLSNDNNFLVGFHEQAKKTIVKLMNTDLLTQGQIWKDEMRHLRDIVAALESKGYTNLDAFKLHWDHQLYKVLEYQYVLGLADMNNKLPDIEIDIVFRQRQLQFRPPEEEIRQKYFSLLRRFIERPTGFRGLSDKSNELFKIMVERNRHHFGTLFKRGEELFKKLEDLKKLWLPWVALGCVDIDELCSVHLNKWEHWDGNFKACKHFSQQVAKIQSYEENLDCFVINILPLRTDIEFLNRRYWEALANSLRISILNDITVLQDFIQSSLKFLQNVPMGESEIAESGAKYEKIMMELPKITRTLESVKSKDTCLAGWCKERVSSLTGLLLQWEKLQPLIENHSAILKRQVEIMRDHVTMKVKNLRDEAEKFLIRWESTISELEANNGASLELFKERQSHWQNIKEKREKLEQESNKYGIEFPSDVQKEFDDIDNTVRTRGIQWQIYEKYINDIEEVGKEEWSVYRRRPYIFNEVLEKWQTSTNSSIDLAASRIRQSVEIYQEAMPILQTLHSDALTERHWAKVFQILKKETKPFHTILLKDILSSAHLLVENSNEIQSLVRQASSEQIVRQALTELEQWGVTAILKLTSHTDSSGNSVSLIKDFQEVLNKIGDNQSLLQSAKNSAAFETFSDQAEIWESRLNNLDQILSSLSQCQRKWIYLEPVFGAGTLKNEEALFRRIDKDFRYIMNEIRNDSRVLTLTKIKNISTVIGSLESSLSRCQNTLISYITTKRNSFPRFNFLSDDDLLEILGQATKEEILQKHIKKLFPGIHSLGIEKSIQDWQPSGSGRGSITEIVKTQPAPLERATSARIIKINSAEGDTILLKSAVEMNGAIEVFLCKYHFKISPIIFIATLLGVQNWLSQLVDSIQTTLKYLIRQCVEISEINDEVLLKFPSQVICIAKAINFTRHVEKAINSMSLSSVLKTLKDEVSHFAQLKNRTQKENVLLQNKLRSLLLDLVHYVSVVEHLIETNVTNHGDWNWLQQMKFYINHEREYQVTVRMVFAEFDYSYEFLGNPNKLVHTRLTHKCYLTLTQAMHLGLGGNPFGPAGTGKTECVKALGAMLGRLVLVFNCDENVDTEAMGLILTGLAQCGAWGCFDEFNRLQEATLSSISMLIQPIQSALKNRNETVEILDRKIQLNHHCGIFVTLNPAGEEYGGRQQLPGNIQALFRPIVMQEPEPKEIAQVMLFVEGFKRANEIGNRIVEIFDLTAKMLSTQRHYDWGLRELKTVLIACGKLLRDKGSEKKSHVEIDNSSMNDEMAMVVDALRSNTMSKLNTDDCKRFDMLLQSVFPDVSGDSRETVTGSNLKTAVEEAFRSLGLRANVKQIEKCLQLYEQLTKRMGVVIVGPPSTGKSTILAVLKQALIATSKTIRSYTISPKSMNKIQLLGRLDPDTRQWTDGVLTTTAMAVNAEPQNVNSWIICDGDVDPEWIEALNSVLDDNKILTLPSGWRIQFDDNVNFIFETHDLSFASPATISRMGIINLSSDDLDYRIVLENWLEKQQNNEILNSLIESHLHSALKLLFSENFKTSKFPIAEISVLCPLRSILSAIGNTQTKEEFTIGLAQSLVSFIEIDKQNSFVNKIFDQANVYISDPTKAEYTYFNQFRETIEIYDADENIANGFSSNSINNGSSKVLQQTGQIKTYLDILRRYLKSEFCSPFIIFGPSGSAKTLLVQHAAAEFVGYQLIIINCSTQLSPNYIINSLKQNSIAISGLRGREYKPQQSRIVLFLKNIDLCFVDIWGTSDVIQLLMQLIHRQGFYSESLEWISVTGVQICASTSSDTPARQSMSSRYLSINSFLRVKCPSENDMILVVENRLRPIIQRFDVRDQQTSSTILINSLIGFFTQIRDTFHPDMRSHYKFTPKMMTKIIDALEKYPENSFHQAFITEIQSHIRDRLTDSEHLAELNRIWDNTLGKVLNPYDKDLYFVPKGPQNDNLQQLSSEEWKNTMNKTLTICNAENLIIENPLIDEMLKLISNLTRILSRMESHVVMVGTAGSRRHDSVYLAATFLSARVFLPNAIAKYCLNDFYSDLKMAMQSSALEDQSTYFLIDHSWISCFPDIMKPIEAILQGSEILEIFGEDLESIASSLKAPAQLEGYQDSLSSYFLKRVQKNLHLVLLLDSEHNQISDLFNTYPALYRNAQIIWIDQSLSNLTFSKLPDSIVKFLSNDNQSIPVPVYMSQIYEPNTKFYVPRQFYQLVRSYYYIFQDYNLKTQKQLGKLKLGVEKLSSAHQVVDELKSNATQQEEALAEKRQLANQALEMISSTMRNANDQKTDLLELKKKTQENSEKLMERQKAIQIELHEVEPILKEASAAVGQIKTEALSEIRSLRAPPETIRDILEGVLRLMGIRDTSWNSMKTFLAKRGVKEDIRSLDPARISPENCESVEGLLKSKAESFDVKNAKRASAAAAPLAIWVIANVRYAKVMQSVKPLEREQNELKKNLQMAESEMRSLMTGLDDVDSRVKELSGQLNTYTQEAAVLELKLDEARNILRSSQVLIEKLGAEFNNWSKQLDEINQTNRKLDLKAFLIATSINLFCSYSFEKRKSLINEAATVLHQSEFDITKSVISEQEQIIWESMGLQKDIQALENAAILCKIMELPFGVTFIPLVVDPSESALTWLKEFLKSSNKSFDIISQNADKLTYNLELSARFGKILIVLDCEEIVPPLLQVIYARTYSKFGKKQLEIGTKLIDLNECFRIVMFTKMDKVEIPAEIHGFVAPIHFTVTAVGLTDQLLSKVICLKRPELEEKRIELLKNEGVLLTQRIQQQDKLLEELSNAQGDILQNTKLLKTLNEVKESTLTIDKSLRESENVRSKLLIEFEQFKEICRNSSAFYMNVIKIYEMPVNAFFKIFLKCLSNAEENIDKRAFYYLIRSTFQYLCRSHQKSDHLTIGMYLSKIAYPGEIPDIEWEIFVTNFMLGDDTIAHSYPTWIRLELIPKVQTLRIHTPEFYKKLDLNDEKRWIKYTTNNQSVEFPDGEFSEFQKVLTAQIFRPDLMIVAMNNVVQKLLGSQRGASSQPSIEDLVGETEPLEPILIIASSENDPSDAINEISTKKFGSNSYKEIAIGKGMEKRTVEAVRAAANYGHWVCLKNIHLVPSLLNHLDHELQSLKAAENFRLFLICENTRKFPTSFTYKCCRVLFESPDGVKNKVIRLLRQWTPQMTSFKQKRDSKTMKLYVTIFLLNAILQERRNFIPQGWSKWYEFGDSDLRAALDILGWLDRGFGAQKLEWHILQGLCENLAYGGRINVEHDLRILIKHLDEFFNEKTLTNRWTPLNWRHSIPTSINIQEYFEAVQLLPDVDPPESFGLSKDTNITKDLAACRLVLKTLRSAYFKNEEQTSSEKRVKPILSLWKKLTASVTVTQTAEMIKENDGSDSWKVFVISELKIAGEIFKEIHGTLVYLRTILKESKSLNGADKSLLATLNENQVPLSWRKIWSGPKLATDYIKSAVQKGIIAEKRYKDEFHLEFIDTFNLNTAFNAATFFSGLKLKCAQLKGKSASDLILFSDIVAISTNVITVRIEPLTIDGACFINQKLTINPENAQSKGEHFSTEFYVTFIEKITNRPKTTGNFQMPVYSNMSREKYICSLNLNSSESADKILLSGAALIIPDM